MSIDFIGVGSGKCGSSWLFQMIQAHPDVFGGNAKELNFFSDRYPYYEKGLEWYREQFAGALESQKCGEFSVTYMYEDAAMSRIREHFPEVRLLVTIRDSADRAFSDYQHSIRKGLIAPTRSFREFIDEDYDLSLGHFVDAIERIYHRFDRSQLLVIPMTAMRDNPRLVLQTVYQHIGVSPDFYPTEAEKPANKGFVPRLLFLERIITTGSRYLTMSGNVALLERLKRTGIVARIRKLNTSRTEAKLSDSDREMLDKVYAREKTFLDAAERPYQG